VQFASRLQETGYLRTPRVVDSPLVHANKGDPLGNRDSENANTITSQQEKSRPDSIATLEF
jgi:hypothetical protein